MEWCEEEGGNGQASHIHECTLSDLDSCIAELFSCGCIKGSKGGGGSNKTFYVLPYLDLIALPLKLTIPGFTSWWGRFS